MKATEIITKAITELRWAEAKLAATGYPGVAEVEQSVKRAMAILKEKAEVEVPAQPSDDPGPFYRALYDHLKQNGPRLVELTTDGLKIGAPPEPEPAKPDPAYLDLMEKVKNGPQLITLGTDGTLQVEAAPPAEA